MTNKNPALFTVTVSLDTNGQLTVKTEGTPNYGLLIKALEEILYQVDESTVTINKTLQLDDDGDFYEVLNEADDGADDGEGSEDDSIAGGEVADADVDDADDGVDDGEGSEDDSIAGGEVADADVDDADDGVDDGEGSEDDSVAGGEVADAEDDAQDCVEGEVANAIGDAE